MYILGRLRTASIPSSTRMLAPVYSEGVVTCPPKSESLTWPLPAWSCDPSVEVAEVWAGRSSVLLRSTITASPQSFDTSHSELSARYSRTVPKKTDASAEDHRQGK